VDNKKRVIKDYDTLPEDIKMKIKMSYPRGFAQHLVYYTDRNNKRVSALPFDTEDIYYLVRMTVREAVQIIEADEDYDSDGVLRDDFAIGGDEEMFDGVKDEVEKVFKEAPESAYDDIDGQEKFDDDDDEDDDDDDEGDDDTESEAEADDEE